MLLSPFRPLSFAAVHVDHPQKGPVMLLSPFPLTLRERCLGQAVQCHDPDLARRAASELVNTLGPDAAYAWADCNGTASILGHPQQARPTPQGARFAAAHAAMTAF